MKVNIKPVLSSPDYKVICISGNAGDVLKQHKVNEPGLLLVKKGTLIYQEENAASIKLKEGEGHNIPPEVYHQVSCVDQAEAFVVLSQKAKMRFEK